MSSRRDATSSGSSKSGERIVGQFTIDKEIGKGSFAQVYMGFHKVIVYGGLFIRDPKADRITRKPKQLSRSSRSTSND